ncbi:unnamed protein product [Sphagnum jensenii]|uniref:Uncharacterized protein n=1 Tax=Sphagnum jensenii TaxID=128206 RepID=A0ABP0ZZR0_9BRYO
MTCVFPVWSRNAINDKREAGYDVLLYVSNWPERRAQAWRSLPPGPRYIENQSYVVGVNRIGTVWGRHILLRRICGARPSRQCPLSPGA